MAEARRQLTLDVGHRTETWSRADFVESPANREALGWIERWPDWPAPALTLYGPPGCGRTHLGRVWAARAEAETMTGKNIAALDVAALAELASRARRVFIDDARLAPERGLFHLYNLLRERGGHLLLAADRPPAQWEIRLPDLASRLRASPAIAIDPPDDELLGSILLKLFADRQLHAAPGVIAYLVSRMERSADAARGLVAALDRRALTEGREIDRRLCADVLGGLSNEPVDR